MFVTGGWHWHWPLRDDAAAPAPPFALSTPLSRAGEELTQTGQRQNAYIRLNGAEKGRCELGQALQPKGTTRLWSIKVREIIPLEDTGLGCPVR